MKNINHRYIIAGVVLLFCHGARVAYSQTQAADGKTSPPLQDRASYPKKPDLVELEKRLRAVILQEQPDAKVEFVFDWLVAHFRSERFHDHLPSDIPHIGETYTKPTQRFSADFSEFLLYIDLRNDVTYYRPNLPVEQPELFGTTLFARYDLRGLPKIKSPQEEPDVPWFHWAYTEYDRLVEAELAPNLYFPEFSKIQAYSGPPITLSRYGFAAATVVAMSRLRYRRQKTDKETIAAIAVAEKAIANLQEEFAPEIAEIDVRAATPDAGSRTDAVRPTVNGQNWHPRYQYLSLRFSYGKGISSTLRDAIKRTIADYAAETLKVDTVKNQVEHVRQ